ncbi:unnamed protein product [Amaranthus hypochondriacus]
MEKLTILAILLLVTLTVPTTTWASMENKKMMEIEIIEEIMKNEKIKGMAEAMEMEKMKLGCVELGGNCENIQCCPTSPNGYRVICASSVCVELIRSKFVS